MPAEPDLSGRSGAVPPALPVTFRVHHGPSVKSGKESVSGEVRAGITIQIF